ncbi:glycosyltransferase family A protein [Nostocoides sp. Soil756]|uniref:glycosyltransferase family 2 protein n=1 Tax=Nostocoides sp. Soil756 TaxID=1736399 RepID=UPI000701BDA7|nr:glycosyltransferase family A protein [Tetrasphaera sp. Soil756]KRE62152.1 hypothetical protein ASG78_03620 [Tetrasphaera sp. Soil756]
MTAPDVSVVIPAYNAADVIARAVRSVLDQEVQDLEVLVVDDASTDDTAAVVTSLAADDPRVRLVRMEHNSGRPAHPRNRGLVEARGTVVALLDADDHWLPGKLTAQVDAMRRSDAAISATGYEVRSPLGERIGAFLPPADAGYRQALRQNPIGCSTAVIDRALVGAVQFPLCGHEDYALWLDLLRRGHRVLGVREVLAVYQDTPGSASSSRRRNAGFLYRIYRDRLGYSVPTSTALTAQYAALATLRYRSTAAAP